MFLSMRRQAKRLPDAVQLHCCVSHSMSSAWYPTAKRLLNQR
jgi:hypothetical protein